jgi:hypothetical protein
VRSAVFLMLCVMVAGCAERMPPAPAATNAKRASFEIVARDNRCTPEVLAADREGRTVLITLQVVSVGKAHWFLIPELNVRRRVPAGMQVTIPFVAEYSGILKYACASSRWVGPFTKTGKLAIR